MKRDTKYDALLRARESAELEAAKYVQEVSVVVERRRNAHAEVAEKKASLERRLRDVRDSARQGAIQTGDCAGIASVGRYEKRLLAEIQRLDELLATRREELEKAEERLRLAEEELVEARVEKKKVEHLVDTKRQERELSEGAWEEALLDEMNTLRPRR